MTVLCLPASTPEPQRAVQPEEPEAAGDQNPVEAVRPPQHRAALRSSRVGMRVVLDEALVGALVALAAGLRPDAPSRPATPDSTRAGCRGRRGSRRTPRRGEAELGHLAVERAAERLDDLRVAGAAFARSTSSRHLSVSARWMACAVWQSAQTGALRVALLQRRGVDALSYVALMPVWHVPQVAGHSRPVDAARPDRCAAGCRACRGSRRRPARRPVRPSLSPRRECCRDTSTRSSSWQLAQLTVASLCRDAGTPQSGEIGMAVDAGHRAVRRVVERLGVDGDGRPFVALRVGVAMAGQAVVVGWRLDDLRLGTRCNREPQKEEGRK